MSTQVLPSQDAFASRAPLAPIGGHKNTDWAGAYPSHAPSAQEELSKKVAQTAQKGLSAAHPRPAGHHLHPAHVVPPQRTRSPSPGQSAQAAAHPTYAAPIASSAGRGRSREVTPKTGSQAHPYIPKGKEPVAIQAPKEIKVGWDTFQEQAERPDFDPTTMYLPKEVYEKADNALSQCIWTINDPECGIRMASVGYTNFIVKSLNREIRLPLATGKLSSQKVSEVYNHVLSFLPKEKPKVDTDLVRGEELWNRAKNIFSLYYQKEVRIFLKWLMAQGVTQEDALDKLAAKRESLADAIGWEALSLVKRYDIHLEKKVEAFKKQVEQNAIRMTMARLGRLKH